MGTLLSVIVTIQFSIQIRSIQPEAEIIEVSYVTDTESDGTRDDLSELTIQDTSEDEEEIQRITFNNDTVHSRRVFLTRDRALEPNQNQPNQNRSTQTEPENSSRPVAEVNPFTHNPFRRSPFGSQRSLVRRNYFHE